MKKMKIVKIKNIIATLALSFSTLLLMSGIFANQALAQAVPVITSANTKSCVADSACSYQITATNSPTSYGVTELPAGLTVDASTGLISGIPRTPGTFPVTVSATNKGGSGSLAVTFTITPPPARVVVAPSGGHYTTITAALAAINPSATSPYVIEVWPGVYTEPGTVVLKSYVHLKGSGRDVTTVKTSLGTSAHVFSANNLTNVTISSLTITGGWHGIEFVNTTGTISENSILNNSQFGASFHSYGNPLTPVLFANNNVIGNSSLAIYVADASPSIINNVISNNSNTAIVLSKSESIIRDNVITANNGVGISVNDLANPTISNNIIANNASTGLAYSSPNSGGTTSNNKIVNNTYADIEVGSTSAVPPPNISFNVVDIISGNRGVGSYNVKSNGDPILVP